MTRVLLFAVEHAGPDPAALGVRHVGDGQRARRSRHDHPPHVRRAARYARKTCIDNLPNCCG